MERRESFERIIEMLVRDNVEKAFQAIADMAESLGGNAGVLPDGRLCAGYNCYFSEKSGLIFLFSNPQELVAETKQRLEDNPDVKQARLRVAFDVAVHKSFQQALPPEALRFEGCNGPLSLQADEVLSRTIVALNKKMRDDHEMKIKMGMYGR